MAYFTGNTGAVDYEALETIRDLFLETEPLVTDQSLDGRLDPHPELTITVAEGFNSNPCGRFDIVWTERNCYNFHYTEPEGIDWRFDRHPEPQAPEKHFHEPPRADSRVESCLVVEPPELVTYAVRKCWRTALSADDPALLNTLSQPP